MSEKTVKHKSFLLAIEIVKLYKLIIETKKEYVLSKQLLRSGTAIGALVREAQNAESSADFIHKLSIAQKECDETLYWLELLKETEFITPLEFDKLNDQTNSILKMLRSSIITMKKKRNS